MAGASGGTVEYSPPRFTQQLPRRDAMKVKELPNIVVAGTIQAVALHRDSRSSELPNRIPSPDLAEESGAWRRWTDLHRMALVPGPLLVSWLAGFLSVTAGNPIDRAGQAVVGVVAAVLLAVFAKRLSARTSRMSELAPVMHAR
jgi:hypothetical protein